MVKTRKPGDRPESFWLTRRRVDDYRRIRMNVSASTAAQSSSSKVALLPVVLLSAFIGAFVVFGVGFAHSNVLHNAAHDSRHALGFPCH